MNKNGFVGFSYGSIKGIIGLFTKPLTGVTDLGSNVLELIINNV